MARTFHRVRRWGAGLPALLAAALCLGPGQAWAETGSQATSTRDEPIRCSIVLGPEAPELEVFAAHELGRYLRELYGIQPELVRALGTGSRLSILLGSPQTNPAFQRISGHHTWPRVSDQGIVLKRVSGADREMLILGGGSPAATLWAVYELVERSGVRFLLEKDVFPEVAEPFPPRQLDLVREPRFRFRSYRAINNLATSLIFYGMKDYRHLIDQLAKMKFNVLYVQIYPHQPFVHYQMRGPTQGHRGSALRLEGPDPCRNHWQGAVRGAKPTGEPGTGRRRHLPGTGESRPGPFARAVCLCQTPRHADRAELQDQPVHQRVQLEAAPVVGPGVHPRGGDERRPQRPPGNLGIRR